MNNINWKYSSNIQKNDVDNTEMANPNNSSDLIQIQPSMDVVENKIYFYADVTREKILRLNKVIEEVGNQLIYKSIVQNHTPAPIYLNIQSYGGSIFSGLSAADTIIRSKVPVITVVDGCAASAATLISITGNTRLMTKNSFVLIHELSSAFWGKHGEFQDELQNQETLMLTIKNMYKQFTKIPMKKLNEILKHDLWLSSAQCVEYSIVDGII